MILTCRNFTFSWLARTNPADVARVEKRTFISTECKRDTIPIPREGVIGELGNWISPRDMEKAILERFPECMKGNFLEKKNISLFNISETIFYFKIHFSTHSFFFFFFNCNPKN